MKNERIKECRGIPVWMPDLIINPDAQCNKIEKGDLIESPVQIMHQ